MSAPPEFRDDLRSTEELVSLALSELCDDLAWQAVTVLHW